MRALTDTQAKILHDIRKMPARFRHQNRPGGPLKPSALEHFDARSLNGLFARGILKHRAVGYDNQCVIDVNED